MKMKIPVIQMKTNQKKRRLSDSDEDKPKNKRRQRTRSFSLGCEVVHQYNEFNDENPAHIDMISIQRKAQEASE